MTSTVLPALFLASLYPLLKRRLFPSSPLTQYKQALATRERSDDIASLADDLIDTATTGAEDFEPGKGFGIGVDFNKAKESFGIRRGAAFEAGVEELVGDERTTGKRKSKLRRRLRALEEEYGAGTIVVLGDLAVRLSLHPVIISNQIKS